MTEFKVGDKVRIINEKNPNYGCITTIFTLGNASSFMSPWVGVEGGLKDEQSNAPEITEIEHYTEAPIEVKEQRQITVSNGNISVNHTVGSKKGRVSFTGFRQAGHIHIEDLDKVIGMLQRLKKEV